MDALVLGCGYTGRRVAALLAAAGHRVWATSRDPASLAGLPVTPLAYARGAALGEAPEGARVLVSVPPGDGPEVPPGLAPARVVYLSSTGVYGEAPEVDAATPAAPVTERQRARLAAEAEVRAGPWSACVLRPAAIYGPGRGVLAAMRAGRYRLVGDGRQWTSRVHVDDLAVHCAAALLGDLEGAWPVADAEPARARDVARWCADTFGLPFPGSVAADEVHETRRFTRRVDASGTRAALRVELRYPSYRDGFVKSEAT